MKENSVMRIWMSVLACVSAVRGTAAAAGLTVAESGEARVPIVIGEKASPLARYAAEELRDHLQRMTGAEFEIAEEGNPGRPAAAGIFVGDTRVSAEAGLRSADLEAERIIVRCAAGRLLLLGGDRGSPRIPPRGVYATGTLSAVHDFLETELGVRWLWPGKDGLVIPKRETVRIPEIDRTYLPPLLQRKIRQGLRDWGGYVERLGMTPVMASALATEYRRWANRRHLGKRANFRFGHAYNNWLRDYGKQHPDWFAMMPDGRRVTPKRPYPSLERAKLCVTNPDLLDFIAERGMAYLEKNPAVLSFSACPNDSRGYCMCPKCKALDPAEGLPTQMNYPGENFMYPSLSDRYVWFWNQLAGRMGNRFPGRYIGAYAYSNYNHPPLRETLSERVVVGYVGFNYLNAEYTRQSRTDWDGWARTGCKLYLRPNLLLAGHGFPLNYARELGADVKHCFETGMLGTDFDSMTHQYAAQAPIFYVLTALLWDPTRDVEDLLQEFLEAAYGPAAVQMAAYWDRLEALTRTIAARNDPGGGHDTTPSFHEMVPVFYDDALLAELRALLAAAREAGAGVPAVVRRIDVAETAVDYADLQRRVLPAVKRYTSAGDNIDEVAALLERKEAFLKSHLTDWTIGVHHVFWREGRSTRHRRMYGGDLPRELSHPRMLARLVHWRFRVDPEANGEKLGWHLPTFDDADWGRATSLGFWEQQGHKGYDGHAWYRRRLSVPEDWRKHDRILLRFGAVDESFRLFVDGRLVAESVYDPARDPDLWKKPREVDLTGVLRSGKTHVLAVDVLDTAGAGGLWKPVFVVYGPE